MNHLEIAIRNALQLLGPEAPTCCGCEYEWSQAIKVLREAIEPVQNEAEPDPMVKTIDPDSRTVSYPPNTIAGIGKVARETFATYLANNEFCKKHDLLGKAQRKTDGNG